MLCMSLIFILSNTVTTMNSGSLSTTFGWADCDIYLDSKVAMEAMTEDGREYLEKRLDIMEKTLADNGMPSKCYYEDQKTLN